MITLNELQEKLKDIDEISLMEVLEITSEDIVEHFLDKIEAKYSELVKDFEEEQDENQDQDRYEF